MLMAEAAGYSDADAKPEMTGHNVAEAGSTMHNNKRKRDSLDHGGNSSRTAPSDQARQRHNHNTSADNEASFLTNHNNSGDDSSTMDFATQLAQHAGEHNLHQNGQNTSASDTAAAALSHYSMTVPQATELSFQSQTSGGDNAGGSFGLGEHQSGHGLGDFDLGSLGQKTGGQGTGEGSPTGGAHKPPVGSEEWHKVRRDNHKEVERRRRETINEGINELAKIVPGCEKNKGSILQRAVQFITQLKENESQNIEKWTLEKLLTEQAISELSASCEKFKAECHKAWQEAETWKKAALGAGVDEDTVKAKGDGGDS